MSTAKERHISAVRRAAGMKGGRATSPAKTKAVRLNGLKGGRPPLKPKRKKKGKP
jgi:hypothetical protein